MKKVFIDGSAGTTGLRIAQRLGDRKDLELLTIPDELRKDPAAKAAVMDQADVVFLCLPDDAAREAVTLISNPATAVIDTSTAHRVSPDWTYGVPEIGGLREKIPSPSASPIRAATPAGSSPWRRPLRRRGSCPRTRPSPASPSRATPAAGKR